MTAPAGASALDPGAVGPAASRRRYGPGGRANGGLAARRALARWAWRLFRREWRQQALVLALLTVAVAATTVGTGLAANAGPNDRAAFGDANYSLTLPGADPGVGADLAAAARHFGAAEAIAHASIPVPGSVTPVDLRAQDPHGRFGAPMLRLDRGRYPTGPNDIAVTSGVTTIFNLRLGSPFRVQGHVRRVVGIVENPLNLQDRFALVGPGQVDPPTTVTILVHSTVRTFASFARGHGASVSVRPSAPGLSPTVGVLVLATIGLLFVGLVAVAGFTVIAGRRLRALGMLVCLGATDRHIRLVVLVNGVVVGVAATLTGTGLGLAVWSVVAPRLEGSIGHRVDRYALPWWAIGAAALLAVVTALVAAWWPARVISRVPAVAALSARPTPPRPAHRFTAAAGVLLVIGLALLVASHQKRPLLIVGGIVATTAGTLMLAPLAIRGLAATGRRAPIAVRLALRDLGRYQARSGAALAAVTLAVGVAATIAISASASQTAAAVPPTGGNLPTNQLVVWFAADGRAGPISDRSPAEMATLRDRLSALVRTLRADRVLGLDLAVNPQFPSVANPNGGPAGESAIMLGKPISVGGGRTEFRGSEAIPLFVATPALLGRYRIDPAAVAPDTDLLTSRPTLAGYEAFPGRNSDWRPKIQTVKLPTYTSDPTVLITAHALRTLHLRPVPAGWLVETSRPLTANQISAARRTAAAIGVSIEARPTTRSQARLRAYATAVGVLVALGVLAMTVGLIRAETAGDLRTLTAAGAGPTTRRTLTGATAGALGLLGAVLGTVSAYLALLAWHRDDLHNLGHPPLVSLLVIVVGLPVIAAGAGWLLAGREPAAVAQRPLE